MIITIKINELITTSLLNINILMLAVLHLASSAC